MSQRYGYMSHALFKRLSSPVSQTLRSNAMRTLPNIQQKKRQERNNKNKTTHFHRVSLRSPDLNFNANPPNKRGKKNVIKVMQMYLLVGSQTSFYGDEMATSNWLDKSMLTSEPKTPESSENLLIPECTDADAEEKGIA